MESRYMIIKYILKPNGQWDEITEFRKNLRPIHIETSKVILDFEKRVCVVNSLNREASFSDMLEMYKRLLGDRLTPHLPEDLRISVDR
jgi:hypothetical protein